MAITIGDAVLYIMGDDTALDKALSAAERKTQTRMRAMEQVTRRAGIAMTALGAALTGGLAASAYSYAKQEAAIAQLEAVLKSTGGAAGLTKKEILEMAAALQKTTTYGDETILTAQNLLLTFTNIKGDTFPQATKIVLDMSTALGQDLKSSAIQVGKALQDPILGVTALRRVGVNFNTQQMEQIKLMVESGDIMGAQKMILAELATEFSGSASAAATTFSGKLTQLKNVFGDLLESIGKAMTGGGEGGMAKFIDYLKSGIEWLIKWIEEHPRLTQVMTLTAGAIGLILTALGSLMIVMPGVIATLGAFGITLSAAIWPITLIAAAVTGLIAVFVYLATMTEEQWDIIYDTIMTTIEDIVSPIRTFYNWIKDLFVRMWNSVKETWSSMWKSISDTATNWINSIKNYVGGWVQWIKDKIREITNLWMNNPLAKGGQGVLQGVTDWYYGVGGNSAGGGAGDMSAARGSQVQTTININAAGMSARQIGYEIKKQTALGWGSMRAEYM